MHAKSLVAGEVFGRWLVLPGPRMIDSGQPKWLCRCECGVERWVNAASLRCGASTSCGRHSKTSDLDGTFIERLRQRLHYDPGTGLFTWRMGCRGVKAGTPAGCLGADGYIAIGFERKIYRAHQLAWMWVYGAKADLVDHRDTCRSNNRIDNLRDATVEINAQNMLRAHCDNQTGFLGVSLHQGTGKYRAEILAGGCRYHLGLHATAEEAHAAYLEAKKHHHEGAFQ